MQRVPGGGGAFSSARDKDGTRTEGRVGSGVQEGRASLPRPRPPQGPRGRGPGAERLGVGRASLQLSLSLPHAVENGQLHLPSEVIPAAHRLPPALAASNNSRPFGAGGVPAPPVP